MNNYRYDEDITMADVWDMPKFSGPRASGLPEITIGPDPFLGEPEEAPF